MDTISVVIPTYNEEGNIIKGYERVKNVFRELPNYQYEMLFIDNCSTDRTREILRKLAEEDSQVKCIFNAKNFGWTRSSFYGIISTTGDCTVLLAADMQEPPEKIIEFVAEWEKGFKIVIGIKSKSNENKLKYYLRNCYYRFIGSIAETEHIKQFMGFGLYNKEFVNVLRGLDDPMPYLRGIVAELGYTRKEILYTQEKRTVGKTHFSFFKVYDLAMLGITSSTKVLMRVATILGFTVAITSFIVALVTFILKIFNIIDYPTGIAAISIGVFFFGAIQLFFIGLLGEYVLNINTRVIKRPLVIEEERLNFVDKL